MSQIHTGGPTTELLDSGGACVLGGWGDRYLEQQVIISLHACHAVHTAQCYYLPRYLTYLPTYLYHRAGGTVLLTWPDPLYTPVILGGPGLKLKSRPHPCTVQYVASESIHPGSSPYAFVQQMFPSHLLYPILNLVRPNQHFIVR